MRIIIQDVQHLKLKQDLLWLGTATLVTVVIWISYAIYAAFNKTTVDSEVQKLLTPLTPTLDRVTLSSLDNRFVPPETFPIYNVTGEGDSRKISTLNSSGEPNLATHSAILTKPAPVVTPVSSSSATVLP
jgi:hypothetical protein